MVRLIIPPVCSVASGQAASRGTACRLLLCTSRNDLGNRDHGSRSYSWTTNTRMTRPVPYTLKKNIQITRRQKIASANPALVEDDSNTPEPTQSTVPITLANGKEHAFSPLILRDLCACPHCVNPSSRQKNFSTLEIPIDVHPASVDVTGSTVRITWQNDIPSWPTDHTTELNLNTLQRLAVIGATKPDLPHQRTLWDAARYSRDIHDVEYPAYMTDDVVLHRVLQQLHSHGLVFITDVPEDTKSVSALAERIAPVKNTFYGYTWDVRSVPKAINVAYTSGHLGFHMDLLYMQQPPHLQLLHCIRASSAGGASLFTDSFRAAADLREQDPTAYETLTELPVHFHYDHPDSQYYHQARRVIELKDESHPTYGPLSNPVEELAAVSWSPPFQGPFTGQPYANSNGQPVGEALRSWHQAASKFNALVERADGIHERMMQPGVCVIFDNRRVLHARKAFAEGDVGKERWLRGAYIDEDPYLSKLRILNDRFRSVGSP